jgi:hypothetical protein
MGFFDLFRRKAPIGSRKALEEFVDRQAAFLAQKGIYEYSRARAGPYSKMLLGEPAFVETVNRARWQAYPLALAMVGELVEGVLRQLAPEGARDSAEAAVALALAVFDHYPTPEALTPVAWAEARAELERRLKGVALHPVKPVKDIPEPYANLYFALMPIHEKLRGEDFPTVQNYLKATLCNIHDELVTRADTRALVAELVARD